MRVYKHKKQTMRQRKMAMRNLFLNKTFRVLFLFVVGFTGFLNIVQITKISTKGYEINDLEKTIVALEHDTERLEFQISQYRSIQSIQERLQNLNMVSEENPEYVVLAGSAVAQR